MTRTLSKSKYISGLQCSKRLWLEIHEPDKATPISDGQRRIFAQGNDVDAYARTHFSGGLLIKVNPLNLAKNVAETKRALGNGAPTIFQATFLYDGVYAIADVLAKNGGGSWDLIEVKSSTRVRNEHIHDLALQKYILVNNGISIQTASVMHINNQCVYPDLSNLFTTEDVTVSVENAVQDVPKNLAKFKAMLQKKSEPNVLIGDHCTAPHVCFFKEYCWQHVGQRAVFDIPGLSKDKKADLRQKGVISLDELPADYPLADKPWAYVNRILERQIDIDSEAIKNKLAELEYPLYFLDFETDNQAIPKFDGARPYQQIPFQYSCHILHEDGSIEHNEYLHTDVTDPRSALVEALINYIGTRGSVIAYNANFEKRVLIDLANRFPEQSEQLHSIADRLWDQLDIFKDYYKHYGFGKSNSLKSVLPVLVPQFSYKDLAVQNGDQAQTVWNSMISMEDGTAKAQLVEDLKAYCRLDTLAMVEIHRVLQEVSQ